MLIGILSDIHEKVDPLENALSHFEHEGTEQVVTLGDAFDTYGPEGESAQVASLLAQAGAVGVWGNHDVGLSQWVCDEIRRDADPVLLDFASKLKPHLVIENCRFSHIEPWLDPRKIRDLWYFDGLPDTPEKASRSFEAVPDQYLFIGHHHIWIVVNPHGRMEWNAKETLSLISDQRHLIAVAAVRDGWCSTFNTQTAELKPIWCGS